MNASPFASTGPAGHRARMRERLLARGADGLADYEILEMLLFIGIRRGDTKPVAKALINHFGSLGGVLAAPPRALAEAGGLTLRAIVPLRLVEAASERLARAEIRVRPVLGNLAALGDYLAGAAGPGPRLLHLDNRNRLLADEASPLDEEATHAMLRAALRRALELHATALLIVDRETPVLAVPTRTRGRAAASLRDAASLLSIVLHDRILAGPSGIRSYRAAGYLE